MLMFQLFYELGCFSFFKEDYETAKQHFTDCYKLYEKLENNPSLKSEVKFCAIDNEKLDGYCTALGIKTKFDVSTPPVDLCQQFKVSVQNHYKVSILT